MEPNLAPSAFPPATQNRGRGAGGDRREGRNEGRVLTAHIIVVVGRVRVDGGQRTALLGLQGRASAHGGLDGG